MNSVSASEPYVLVVKNLPADVGDMRHGFSPLVRKIPAGGNSNPLQYSCLEKPVDRGAWRAAARGRTEWATAGD